MVEYQGTSGAYSSWEETYRSFQAEELPWNAGMADSDLRDLLTATQMSPGRAYDLGCGPGNDAAFLAKEGWNVTAVDISPTAVELARKTATQAGVKEKIQFQVGDVLALPAKGDAALVHDRGCFHTLPSVLWPKYLQTVTGLLKKDGLLTLKVFSFKEPQRTDGSGPYRFTAEELERVFDGAFRLTALKEGIFHGPRKPYSLFAVFKRHLK